MLPIAIQMDLDFHRDSRVRHITSTVPSVPALTRAPVLKKRARGESCEGGSFISKEKRIVEEIGLRTQRDDGGHGDSGRSDARGGATYSSGQGGGR